MDLTAAHLLRTARLRAGLTQTALATHAGVNQSVISAYEAGHREPSFETLGKLIAASGFRLDVQLAPDVERSDLRKRVDFHRGEIVALFAESGATNVRLVGSVARNEDHSESDVDFLVDLDEGVGLLSLVKMKRKAEVLLGSPVDVVPSDGVKREVAQSILSEAVAL